MQRMPGDWSYVALISCFERSNARFCSNVSGGGELCCATVTREPRSTLWPYILRGDKLVLDGESRTMPASLVEVRGCWRAGAGTCDTLSSGSGIGQAGCD